MNVAAIVMEYHDNVVVFGVITYGYIFTTCYMLLQWVILQFLQAGLSQRFVTRHATKSLRESRKAV